jgi:hypothetical protein
VLVLIDQGSALQIVVAIVFVQLFTKLYGYYAPFDDSYVDVIAEFSQHQLFGVFFIALLIRSGKRYDFLFVCCCVVVSSDVQFVICSNNLLSLPLLLFQRVPHCKKQNV